ncbi:MAG: DUF3394 domain-containing protein, partial [Plesiomonas sp.]
LTVPDGASGEERLEKLGISTYQEDNITRIDTVTFGSPAAAAGVEFDQTLLQVSTPTTRIPKEIMWIPAFILFVFIIQLQRRRIMKNKTDDALPTELISNPAK